VRLSLQVQYAICGVFDLAYNGAGQRVSVQEIGARQGIPVRYLEQIFQRLRRAELVESKRGPGGGYALVGDPAGIRLRSIVEAVEGPLAEVMIATDAAPAAALAYRPGFLWEQLVARIAACLDELSVADLCRHAGEARTPRAEREGPMYFI
jgi:Rrf2 family iron-sulfur cluster assembly transcriptional regulator